MITEFLSRYSELLSLTCVFIAAPADLYLVVCAIDRWQRAEHHATYGGSSFARRREQLHRRLTALYVLGIIVITSLASLVLLCLR